MTSQGGAYGAIPLITGSKGNTLVSVDQCRAAHAERDIKPKVRQGASAAREDPDKGKTFLGYCVVEPEERPRGGGSSIGWKKMRASHRGVWFLRKMNASSLRSGVRREWNMMITRG